MRSTALNWLYGTYLFLRPTKIFRYLTNESKITEQEIINKESAVNQQAFLLFAAVCWEGNPIFIIFGSVLVETVKEVYYLTHSFSSNKFTPFLKSSVRGLFHAYFEDVVSDTFKSPARQYYFMSSLWIFTDHPINQPIIFVIDLQFLIVLSPAATVQNTPLDYFSHQTLLISDLNSWPVLLAKTQIGLSSSLVRYVIVVILSDNLPWPM